MDPQSYRFAAEWAGNAEWELAIETLWEESDRVAVRLSEAEGKELAELSTHPSVNQLMLRSNGANQARRATFAVAD